MTAVFIGSTAIDLPDYRKAAIMVCNRLGLQPVAMEYFEAVGAGVTEASKAKVAISDVYVGIFAHRLGYTEEGHSKAVIEEEFDYAGELGIERLCFLVDPREPWPVGAIDFPNYERLQRFKARVDRSVVRAMFTTVDDFTAKLTHSLVEWRDRTLSAAVPASMTTSLRVPPGLATPSAPQLLVGRESDMLALKARIAGANDPADRQLTTIVRGWPGVGKSTLLAALAHDSEVHAAFPDGILWAAAGENPDLPQTLNSLLERLSGRPSARPRAVGESIQELRLLLRGRQVLLLSDDIWDFATAAAFQFIGPPAAAVFTTRFLDIAQYIARTPADIYLLKQLGSEHTLKLFAELAPSVTARNENEVRSLLPVVEGLPLAIRVAARMLEAELAMGWGISKLLQDLLEGTSLLNETAPADRLDPVTGEIPSVSLILAKSTDRLDPETQRRFSRLGSFASRPATFGLNDLQAVWQVDDPRPTARLLADRGLLEPILGTGRFQIHALLALHARSMHSDEVELDEFDSG